MFDAIPLEIWLISGAVAVFAGIVKGMVGFAMPMILISGISSFTSPELALAALIMPTVASNVVQVLRGGISGAVSSLREFALFIGVMLCALAISAQFVPRLPSQVLLLCVGFPVTLLSAIQIMGWRPRISKVAIVEVPVAAFAGAMGGIGGVWGPPTTLYLTAIGTTKAMQIRAQGAIYGTGSVVLLASHFRSGILNSATLGYSLAMIVPALAGMAIGFLLHDRMDQDRFRMLTLTVLMLAGLNLIRRGLAG